MSALILFLHFRVHRLPFFNLPLYFSYYSDTVKKGFFPFFILYSLEFWNSAQLNKSPKHTDLEFKKMK